MKPISIWEILLFLPQAIHEINCGKTSKWDYCDCEWIPPKDPWSTCSKECNGVRTRSKWVRYTIKDGCDSFGSCSDDPPYRERCNTFCFNGGTSDSYTCDCVTGFYGDCCAKKTTCGHPGSLSNGRFSGTDFTYGGSIYYHCNSGYKLIGRHSTRRCKKKYSWSDVGVWNGYKPRCAYFNSCGSSPCKNGATCTNVPDSYRCSCAEGWTGQQCTKDIRPPSMSGCPNDMDIETSSVTQEVSWNAPHFWDPHGNNVTVAHNYPKNRWTFPWGDFTVSFSALKPLNGLRIGCVFNIRIRPFPCKALVVPEHVAVVCNQWRTDYGQVCLNMCQANYTVPRGTLPNQWYVCVASGSWMPNDAVTKCSARIAKLPTRTGYNFGTSFQSCTAQNDIKAMQAYYIEELKKSSFKFLCDKFADECSENKVSVTCL